MSLLRYLKMFRILPVVVLVGLAMQCHIGQAADAYLGNMKANRILFLGNSIALSGLNWWGLTASSQTKDYVHLLAGSITDCTGVSLRLDPMGPKDQQTDGTYTAGDANIVNVADIFERGYATYPGSNRLEQQLSWQPDLVVLQIGENVPSTGFDATVFKSSMETLMTELKECNNPHIFMTSCILGANPTIDGIKKEIVAEDTAHRVFVDLNSVRQDPLNIENVYRHPSDQGMQVIADNIFSAMVAHSVPEPSSFVLASVGVLSLAGFLRRSR